MTSIQVDYISGFSEADKERMKTVTERLIQLVNSDAFEQAVLSVPSFKKNKIKRKTGNKKYSHREILDLIRSGEDLNHPADGVINLKLELYDEELNEMGHTNMTTLVISTFREHFNKDINHYAAHIMHEYMHAIGFTHPFLGYFGKRAKTVPYRIGVLSEKLLNKMYE